MSISIETNGELLTKLYLIWNINQEVTNTFIDENEKDFISKVIYYRTKEFNLKIPTELGYIISVCSGGNPGMAIIIYYELLKGIIKNNGKFPRDGSYIITPIDFALVFGNSFPNMEIESQQNKFQELWDAQKTEDGRNKVDDPEYWDQLFE